MVVVIDNASFHKSKKIINLVEAVSCKIIFLPPYSPDFNPIEQGSLSDARIWDNNAFPISKYLVKCLRHNESCYSWHQLFESRIAHKTEQGLMLTGLRLREGLTQKQFGKILGVSQTNICARENGRRSIGKKMAQKLAALFKVKYQLFL